MNYGSWEERVKAQKLILQCYVKQGKTYETFIFYFGTYLGVITCLVFC
jgi:hypothetical protein